MSQIIHSNQRYLSFQFFSPNGNLSIDEAMATGLLTKQISTFHGESGRNSVIWQFLSFDQLTNVAVVQVSKKSTDSFIAAVSFIPLNNKPFLAQLSKNPLPQYSIPTLPE
ncbi:hypothetical protein BLNAU_373 [Blattamonas nauphoetae]|uniref:Uncharacterized protein n=1 Tax=Blattamonas nauphoetae TaxID=2049346 RepID=A0ABQ9YL14_9EUKA|nr:hypothetical protein BLNAU_373 [Blattamonas nauphoetae]